MTTILLLFWDGVNDSATVEHYVASFEGEVGLRPYLDGIIGTIPYLDGRAGFEPYLDGIGGQDG